MSPLLEPGTKSEDLEGRKYVRVGKDIAYGDSGRDYHVTIANRHFRGQLDFSGDVPGVDDGGQIIFWGGTLRFAGIPPTSCRIKGNIQGDIGGIENLKRARSKTKEEAIKVLGPERVG